MSLSAVNKVLSLPEEVTGSKIFQSALTHRSAGKDNNERLEFLGDAVQNLAEVSPVVDLSYHALGGDGVSHSIQKLLHCPCPHVHVIIQNTDSFLCHVLLQMSDRVFNFLVVKDFS